MLFKVSHGIGQSFLGHLPTDTHVVRRRASILSRKYFMLSCFLHTLIRCCRVAGLLLAHVRMHVCSHCIDCKQETREVIYVCLF